jgi:hypothetical protein
VPVVGAGIGERAQQGAGLTEALVGADLPLQVGQAQAGRQRGLLGAQVIVPVSPPVEKAREGRRQLAGVGVEARPDGQGDDREQYPVLGLEPGHRLRVVGDVFRAHPGLRRDQGDRVEVRGQQGRGMCGVQVMIEHPADGRTALRLAVLGDGPLRGVGAEPARTSAQPRRGSMQTLTAIRVKISGPLAVTSAPACTCT